MATSAIVEEVAENFEEAAELTRRISTKGVGIFLGGVCVGAAIGFYFGYRYNREKIRAEAFTESEEEIDKMREVYKAREARHVAASMEKPSVEEIIRERGYSVKTEAEERPLPAPVPIMAPPIASPVIPSSPKEAPSTSKAWIWAKELESRNPNVPYVIHEDEFTNSEMVGYSQVAYTYYSLDDVLVDEDDKPLVHADMVVGQDNLKWGHGTSDPNTVFIRNDKLELEAEITRSPGSYEEDVMGLEHSDDPRMRRRRGRFDDE